MARKSYDRMYREYDVKNYEKNIEKKVEEPVKEEKTEKVEDVKEEPKIVTGTVIGGAALNVRKTPKGEVIRSINEGTQVVIVDDSDPEWYKISNPEEGYVMKKFVRA